MTVEREFQECYLEWHESINNFYVDKNEPDENVDTDLGGWVIEDGDDWLSFWAVDLVGAPHLKYETLYEGNIRRFQNIREALVWAHLNWFFEGNLDQAQYSEQEVDEFLHNWASQEFGDILSEGRQRCYELADKLGIDRNVAKTIMSEI